jgi:hypothetical protein
MKSKSENKLSGFEKIEILLNYGTNNEVFWQKIAILDPEELLEIRNLIEELQIQKFNEDPAHKMTKGELRKSWIPVNTYFNTHICDLSLDYCTSETCYKENPACFTDKLKGHIEAMMKTYTGLKADKNQE